MTIIHSPLLIDGIVLYEEDGSDAVTLRLEDCLVFFTAVELVDLTKFAH